MFRHLVKKILWTRRRRSRKVASISGRWERGGFFRMQNQMDTLVPVESAPRRTGEGNVVLAGCGAFLLPGLGHLLTGRPLRGILWFASALSIVLGTTLVLLFPQAMPALFLLIPLFVVMFLAQVIDAGRRARQFQSILRPAAVRWIVAIMLGVLGYISNTQAIIFLGDHCFEIGYSPTESMLPTIQTTDRFLMIKNYPVKRWDLISLTPADEDLHFRALLKRVVGLPGETVEITGDALLINGQPMALPPGIGPYVPMDRWQRLLVMPDPANAASGCWGRPIQLADDEYFMLGDNTMYSKDSRFWMSMDGRTPGALPAARIQARAVAIFWPLYRWRAFQ